MTRRALAVLLTAALVSPSAAQVRTAPVRAVPGASLALPLTPAPVLPPLAYGASLTPALSPTLVFAAPAAPAAPSGVAGFATTAAGAPAPANSLPLAHAARSGAPAPANSLPLAHAARPGAPAPANSLPLAHAARPGAPAPASEAAKAEADRLWTGEVERESAGEAVPVLPPAAAARSARPLPRASMAAAAVAVPVAPLALTGLAAKAAPFAEVAAVLAGAYFAVRASRWAVDKLAARFGWDRNAVVMARFALGVGLWTAGAATGLHLLGASNELLMATFGAGGTAMAIAVKDVLGNLVHGVHFLLSRPYGVGDAITVGKTAGRVHELTLRYMILSTPEGFVVMTYSHLANKPVTVHGEYRTKEMRLRLRRPTLPSGLWGAFKDASSPALWKPAGLAALAAAALYALPLAAGLLAGTKALGVFSAVLPWAKAAVWVFLTRSVSQAALGAIHRLAARYGWSAPSTTVAKLLSRLAVWLIGGSLALNALGVTWGYLAASLSITTIVVGVAVNDLVAAVFQGALLLLLRPFEVGDKIRVGELEGVVADITFQHVVLALDDGRHVLVPNAVVKDSAVTTPREYGRRKE